MIKASPEELKQAPFENLRNGKVRDNLDDINNTLKNSQHLQKVYCRNDYIQKIVSLLTLGDVNQINVSGLSGVGKLLISGAAIKYVLDRNYYPDGAIEIEQS